jgi:hypothetical protein
MYDLPTAEITKKSRRSADIFGAGIGLIGV